MPNGSESAAKRRSLISTGDGAEVRDLGNETTRINAVELRALVSRSADVSGAFLKIDPSELSDDRPTTIAPAPMPVRAGVVRVAEEEPRMVVDFEQNVLGRGYFTRRFVAVVLLAIVVVAQPWCGDGGRVRVGAAAGAVAALGR
jgi:hypothetical protein